MQVKIMEPGWDWAAAELYSLPIIPSATLLIKTAEEAKFISSLS